MDDKRPVRLQQAESLWLAWLLTPSWFRMLAEREGPCKGTVEN